MMTKSTKEPKGYKKNEQKGKVGTTTPSLPKVPRRWPYTRWC